MSEDPTSDAVASRDSVSRLEARVRTLETSLRALRRLVIGGACIVLAGLLLAGTLLPFAIEHQGSEDERTHSVLTKVGYGIDDGDTSRSAEEWMFVIGFVGLLLVLALMLVLVLPALGRGTLTPGLRRIAVVLVVLAVIGALVVLLLAQPSSGIGKDMGPGSFVLLAGVCGTAVMLTPWLAPFVSPDER